MSDTIFEYKEPENPQTIGEIVRGLRVKAGMSQGDLAKWAKLTVNKVALLEADKIEASELLEWQVVKLKPDEDPKRPTGAPDYICLDEMSKWPPDEDDDD